MKIPDRKAWESPEFTKSTQQMQIVLIINEVVCICTSLVNDEDTAHMRSNPLFDSSKQTIAIAPGEANRFCCITKDLEKRHALSISIPPTDG